MVGYLGTVTLDFNSYYCTLQPTRVQVLFMVVWFIRFVTHLQLFERKPGHQRLISVQIVQLFYSLLTPVSGLSSHLHLKKNIQKATLTKTSFPILV